MSKKKLEEGNTEEQAACEIIELAINDIDLLTKAFTMINRVCDQLDAEEDAEDNLMHGVPEHLMH